MSRQGYAIALVTLLIRTLPAVLVLAACDEDGSPQRADAAYLSLEGAYVERVLPPPPDGDRALPRELAALHAILAERTPQDLERAQDDAAVTVFRFADVLGAEFSDATAPVTAQFFAKVNRDLGRYITAAKNCWRRPRPFELDTTIQPGDDLLASTGMRTSAPPPLAADDTPCSKNPSSSGYSFSYPSGHATFGMMTAILLAHMVPEKHAELFERGREYGDARLIGGVHFPSDIEAGRMLAAVVAVLMMREERFCTDLAAARAELRAVLGYERLVGPACAGG